MNPTAVLTAGCVAFAAASAPAQTALCATVAANVRSGPSSAYALLGQVPAGHHYAGRVRNGGWWQIAFDGRLGWTPATAWKGVSGRTGLLVLPDTLRVRSGPGRAYREVGRALQGQVYGWASESSGWYRLFFGGKIRYVNSAFIRQVALAEGAGSAPTALASDAFTRTAADGWGAADVGGAYVLHGPAADFDVAGSAGTILLPAPGANRGAFLAGVSADDVEIALRVRTDKPASGAGLFLYAAARRVDAANAYRFKLFLAPDGGVYVHASRVLNNAEQPVGDKVRVDGLVHAPGAVLRLRGRVTGRNPAALRVKAWADGAAEPAAWAYAATDDAPVLQAAGGVGVQAYLSGSATDAPVTVAWEEFTATAVRAAVEVPADALYAAEWGDDGNPGTAALPLRTLQRAADIVPAGGTVVVRRGTYAGFLLTRSGNPGAPITFMAYPGERPVVDGGGRAEYTIRLTRVEHVRLTGLTVQGGFAEKQQGGGVLVANSSRVEVRGCLLTGNKAFGVRSQNSTGVTIDGNEVTRNAVGVHIGGAGEGTFVTNNLIHHNDKMMVNTPDIPGDDAGGEGVALVRTTGRVVVSGNRIWGNRSPSYDFGWDGGAFSIYAASRWDIHDNVTWDNRNVLESGTDANRTPCDGNRFTRNVNYGATTTDRTVGMVLRCASNTLVANNTFHDIQYFVFDLSHNKGSWGGSIEGLQVVNNAVWIASGKVYGIETALPASVTVDHNLVINAGTGYLATVAGRGGTRDLATFRGWTGLEIHGIQADPGFVDAAKFDFRLRADSPGVDTGRFVAGVTEGYAGAAPDRGAFERR